MENLKRLCEDEIVRALTPGNAVLLFGARRVGKTVLANAVRERIGGRSLVLCGDDLDAHALLEEKTAANFRRIFGEIDFLLIDEAQEIPDIGAKMKLIADTLPQLKLLATGSSSFDLQNRAGEPLVGRASSFLLYPFSQAELAARENPLETRQNLETRLIYGAFPQTVGMADDAARANYLRELVGAYLLKDILELDGLRNASKMRDLLRLIALQCGDEVSLAELASALGLSRNTVEKYLDLLSKVFVVFRLRGFSANLRKEISKSDKWFFCDNGIRNAVLNRFSPIALRDDAGRLWENYVISEKIKQNAFTRRGSEFYFWRTYSGQEIDLVETDSRGGISASEMKWGNSNPCVPPAFRKAYPDATFQVINRKNYLPFITS